MADLDPLYRALAKQTTNLVCPTCGHVDWGRTDDYVVQLVATGEPGIFSGRQSFDAVPVFCNNCGFIKLHLVDALVSQLPTAERDKWTSDNEDAEEKPT